MSTESNAGGLLKGYPQLASFIAKDQDAAIYSRYESLSARNLLYLSSEINELKGKLAELDQADSKSSCFNTEGAARKWEHYKNSTYPSVMKHRELQETIRKKLKEYHKALILESQVLALQKPSLMTVQNVRRWFSRDEQPELLGKDSSVFDDENDLVALAPVDEDKLYTFLRSCLGWMFEERASRAYRRDEGGDLYYFPEKSIQRASIAVSIVLSAILLIGAITCLYLLSNKSKSLLLGMIVLFTCMFAGVVGLLTNARRAEIFGSTAAYAAVLVVFMKARELSENYLRKTMANIKEAEAQDNRSEVDGASHGGVNLAATEAFARKHTMRALMSKIIGRSNETGDVENNKHGADRTGDY